MTENKATDDTHGIGDTLRSVAEGLRGGTSQEHTLAQAVESIADATDALRDKRLSDAVQSIDAYARANPLVFIGAAALTGFAATRLVKALASDKSEPPSKSSKV